MCGRYTQTAAFDEAVFWATLLNIDVPGLMDETAEAIPYAKSWGADVTDDWRSEP